MPNVSDVPHKLQYLVDPAHGETDMTSNTRVRIVQGTSEFEVEGDEKFVREMLKRYEQRSLDGDAKGKTAGSEDGISPSDLPKASSPREFLQRTQAKRHADRVLAYGYYLEKYLGKPEFTAADINHLYYESKLVPSNTSQAIINQIKKGNLMEAAGQKKGAGKKRYRLTHSGETFIENRL